MNDLEFSFEPSLWENWLRTKQMGDRISAADLLTILEEENEQAAEDALQEMEMACMMLDISDLPKNNGSGEAAVRLRREIELAKDGIHPKQLEENDPLRVYLEEIAAIPVCGEELILAEACAKGDGSAMEQLTNLGLSQVIAIAKEYVGYGVLLLDLIQEGSLGLWKAIQNYHGGDYAAHRDKWIRFYMAKVIFLQARAGGVGQKLRTAMEDYRAVDERLLADLGRNPTVEEIAEELHLSVEETEAVRRTLENARMMHKTHQETEEPEPTEEDEQAVENTALFQMRARISEMLSGLEETDQKLLTLRFGLEGGLPLSTEETGRKLGLTPEEVTAREAVALGKLRTKA